MHRSETVLFFIIIITFSFGRGSQIDFFRRKFAQTSVQTKKTIFDVKRYIPPCGFRQNVMEAPSPTQQRWPQVTLP